MRTKSSSSLQSEINVTPLVDVCLVLLIIFMVVVPAMVTGTTVALPETKHGAAIEQMQKPVTIVIKDDATVYLDTLVIRADQLETELAALHAREPNRAIAVRADKRVPYGDVAEVLAACRAAGFDDVSLITLKKREP